MSKQNHQFLLMWDQQGLEYCADITQDQQDRIWNVLQGKEHVSRIPNYMHLELRARYNSQRHYEIWLVNATKGITEECLREMFESEPQVAADTIRSKGHCLYSDRQKDNDIKIR